jgi:DnaJ-class molecular chaperone
MSRVGKYMNLDNIVRYNDPYPEEYLAWLDEYKEIKNAEIKKDIEEESKEESEDISCECPECFGTGFSDGASCPDCNGNGYIGAKYINDMMDNIAEASIYVAVVTEEAKVTIAISDMVEAGIEMLEEPEYQVKSKDVLNKLKIIEKVLKDGRYNGSNL